MDPATFLACLALGTVLTGAACSSSSPSESSDDTDNEGFRDIDYDYGDNGSQSNPAGERQTTLDEFM